MLSNNNIPTFPYLLQFIGWSPALFKLAIQVNIFLTVCNLTRGISVVTCIVTDLSKTPTAKKFLICNLVLLENYIKSLFKLAPFFSLQRIRAMRQCLTQDKFPNLPKDQEDCSSKNGVCYCSTRTPVLIKKILQLTKVQICMHSSPKIEN